MLGWRTSYIGTRARAEAVMSADRSTAGSASGSGGGEVAAGPVSPSLASEVTYISGVNADGTVAAQSFSTWNHDAPATYSATDSFASKWGADAAGTAGGTILYWFDAASAWTTTEKNAFVAGLTLWSNLANIKFSLAGSAAAAQVTFTRNNAGSAHTTGAFSGSGTPGAVGGTHLWTRTTSDVTIDTSVPSFGPIDGLFTTAGGYVWGTILHEEGHMLGLGHSGGYDGNVDNMTQQYSAYDSSLWSIMSYIDPQEAALFSSQYTVTGTSWGTSADHFGRSPTTPMALDILAVQRLYGAPTTTVFVGGQTYGFNCNITGTSKSFYDFTVNTDPIVTIWNKGGSNTLDLSGFSTSSVVNLTAGSFSSCDGMVNNICIAFDTRIDKAVGGTGNDTLRANDNGDKLYGGGGSDTLTGGTGADLLDGGLGGDTMTGGAGNDTYVVDSLSDVIVEAVSGGTDTVLAGITFSVAAIYVENITLTGSLFLSATGNGLDNLLIGNSGNNILNGNVGADTMIGGTGSDYYYVDSIFDTVAEYAGEGTDMVYALVSYSIGANVENLTLLGTANLDANGNDLNNFLFGNSGNNTLTANGGADYIFALGGNDVLDGGAGADGMYGGSGNDTYMVDNFADLCNEQSTGTGIDDGGTDLVISSANFQLSGFIENLTLTGTAVVGAGNASNNIILGNASGNYLFGLDGTDTLNGGAGGDALYGGTGADAFVFDLASGFDVIGDFSAAEGDTINLHAYANGVVNGAGIVITASGGSTYVNMGSGNVIFVANASVSDVSSHIVW